MTGQVHRAVQCPIYVPQATWVLRTRRRSQFYAGVRKEANLLSDLKATTTPIRETCTTPIATSSEGTEVPPSQQIGESPCDLINQPRTAQVVVEVVVVVVVVALETFCLRGGRHVYSWYTHAL